MGEAAIGTLRLAVGADPAEGRAEQVASRGFRFARKAFCFAIGTARDVAEARRLTGGARWTAVASFDPAGKPGRGA